MNPTPKYQLFIGNHCTSCEKIITFLTKKNIPISITNIDTEDYDLPFCLMIIPALVKGDKLIGYGCDIKKHFNSR